MTPTQALLFRPEIVVHVAAATLSLALGAFVLLGRKGTPAHRLAGRVWVLAMATTAAGSFLIQAQVLGVHTPLGTFGPIHLLSAAMLVQLWRAITAARAGEIAVHRRFMTRAFAALVIAGLFTMLPTRTLGAWAGAWLA
ncbi:MAG: DUF2306 domain-containing protein [Burkholderiales bacterium]|jgi:uncharacterized membrane protein